jgi:RimJ/RimL family protein N-acetyltransferase
LPALLIVAAENQEALAEAVDAASAAKNLGGAKSLEAVDIAAEIRHLLINRDQRATMSRAGRKLVDGQGTERVIMRMTDCPFRLTAAREEDCQLLWEWANEPGVRAMAFSTAPIPWAVHVAWFERKLRDRKCWIFVARDRDDNPIGQVRLEETQPGNAEIDVHLEKKRRAAGLGTQLLNSAMTTVFRENRVHKVHAYVKLGNLMSLRAFEKAGFTNMGVETIRGHRAAHLLRTHFAE